MITRYGLRIAVAYKVILARERSFCEGRVLDVPLPGCLIERSGPRS